MRPPKLTTVAGLGMDQNRCLLDVINDPQLLRSFLQESGPDATSTTNTTTPANNINTPSVTTTTISNSSPITSSTQSEKEIVVPETTENTIQNSFPSPTAPSSCSQFTSSEPTANRDHTNVTQNSIEVQPQTPPRQHSEFMDTMLQQQQDTILPQQDTSSSNEQASIPNFSPVNTSAQEPIADVSAAATVAFTPTSTPSTPASAAPISIMSPSTNQVAMSHPLQVQTPAVTTSNLITIPSISSPTPVPTRPPPQSTGTKRAARGGGRSTTRAPRTKNSKSASNNQSTPIITNHQNMQQSIAYNPNSGPQILIQNPNTGIRQQAILGQTMGPRQTLGQGLATLSHQRLIQIQTANGPMYFAIASASPQNISNNDNSMMMNQQSPMQQQAQGIRLQGNTTVMLNGQQMSNIQQQQRISSPFISNQVAMSNQSLEQNRYCTNSSGQIMMQNQNLQNSQLQTAQQQSQSMSLQANSTVMLNGQQVHSVQQQQRLPLSIMPSQSIAMQNQQLDHQNQLSSNQSNQILVQGQNIQNFQQQQMGQQGNTGMMVNGQQQQQQQQQQQMVLSPQQQNLGSPIIPNQSISMSNQQSPTITTSQPQHMMMPSTSQSQVMMPRVSNLILNRPLGNPGQLLPGQQQFIQIQTANGPVLLAIPTHQQHQIQTNQTMVDYGSQIQQQQNRMPNVTLQHQQQPKQALTPNKQQSNSKPGLNLGDLLLSHGILPEEKSPPSSPNCQNSSQTSTPMPALQSTPQPMETIQSVPVTPTQPQLQQPVRIAINPDGSVIFPPQIFGAIRPMINNMSNVVTNNAVNNLPLINTTTTSTSVATPSTTPTITKKVTKATKGTKSTTTKRSRSKKNEIEKFPTLKTPCRRQQLAAQQQMQSVAAMIPISVIVDNSNNSITDIKPNISEIPQVPIAKIMTPVVQTAALQPLSSGTLSTSFITTDTNLVGGPALTNQASIIGPATPLNQTTSSSLVSPRTTTNISIATASGNVDSNPHPTIDNVTSSRLIESIVPISSSTSIASTSASVAPENVKIEPNTITETHHNSTTLVALSSSIINETSSNGMISSSQQHNLGHSSGIRTTTDVFPQPIHRQLEADQGAALNPQIKQPFKSLEDACKRLLRYHVFDSPTISESDIEKVDQIFEVAAETLLAKKKKIYDKFRLLVLKQSMNIVPKAEQVMIDQIFINEEQAFLKKARDSINDGEILDPDSLLPTERQDTTSLTLSPTKQDHDEINQDDCAINATDYLTYGDKSPESRSDDLDNLHRSPSKMDNWLMSDKWNKSRFSSVPDSEAALAIESILDDELS